MIRPLSCGEKPLRNDDEQIDRQSERREKDIKVVNFQRAARGQAALVAVQHRIKARSLHW